jgi:hypothetical protein
MCQVNNEIRRILCRWWSLWLFLIVGCSVVVVVHSFQHVVPVKFRSTTITKPISSLRQQLPQQHHSYTIQRHDTMHTTKITRPRYYHGVISSSLQQQSRGPSSLSLSLYHLDGIDPVESFFLSVTTTSLASPFSSTPTMSLARFDDDSMISNTIPIVLFFAIVIGIVANGWIQTLLKGDQGLGSYLSDGSGYQKSSFRPLSAKGKNNSNNNNSNSKNNDNMVAVKSDPLPWLKLPQLDFVEVAGQVKTNNNINSPEDGWKSLWSNRPNEEGKMSSMKSFQNGGDNNNKNNPNQALLDETLLLQLERLRLEMSYQLQQGNIDDAIVIRNELEKMMKENNIEYK